jgi:hypothetical protein
LSEIFLYFLRFEEPYETEYIGEEYLEKYTTDTEKFTENSITVSARRNNSHEVSYLVGKRPPFTERVLETRYTEIN